MKNDVHRALLLGVTLALMATGLSPSTPASSPASTLLVQGHPKPPKPGLAPVAAVVTRRDVETELALTKDQKKAIKALIKAAKSPAAKAELDAKIVALLTEAQAIRLQGIRIQLAGLTAAFDPEIQEAIGVTEEQAAQLEELLRKLGKKGRKPTWEQFEALIAEILTDEQEQALRALGGLTFPSGP